MLSVFFIFAPPPLSRFGTCAQESLSQVVFRPSGKFQGIGYGVHPEFTFHTCTTQLEVLCTEAFTTASIPPHYSGERLSSRVQQTEAGSDIFTQMPRSFDHVYSTSTPTSAFITTNSHDIFVGVFRTCVSPLFYLEIFVLVFVFSFLHVSRFRSIINPPHTLTLFQRTLYEEVRWIKSAETT